VLVAAILAPIGVSPRVARTLPVSVLAGVLSVRWCRMSAMGKRNRERRAAKQRARRQSGTARPNHRMPFEAGDTSFDWDDPAARTEAVATTLGQAAVAQLHGDDTAAARCGTELAVGHHRMVDTAAALALTRVITLAWQRGWLPVDVDNTVRRQLDDASAGLLVDAIAADAEQYAEARVHERWREQLHQLEASVWWDRGRPHLSQWAQRGGWSRSQALTMVIRVFATLMSLPELPRIVPPPGAATSGTTARAGVDEKVLARVRNLLAKAESTTFAEEAEALSAKAQELMSKHAFERALVDAVDHRPQEASSRRLWLDAPYVDAKAGLVDAVASANRCRAVFYSRLGFVTLVGHEVDLEIVQLLSTSLQVQATRALVAAGSHVSRDGRSRTRSFRQSFLIAYAHRIRQRLDTADATDDAVAADKRLVPVLADRGRAVDELFDAMFSRTTTRAHSVSNAAGWGAGLAAADHANLSLERSALPA
jgi:hypothetical protein